MSILDDDLSKNEELTEKVTKLQIQIIKLNTENENYKYKNKQNAKINQKLTSKLD